MVHPDHIVITRHMICWSRAKRVCCPLPARKINPAKPEFPWRISPPACTPILEFSRLSFCDKGQVREQPLMCLYSKHSANGWAIRHTTRLTAGTRRHEPAPAMQRLLLMVLSRTQTESPFFLPFRMSANGRDSAGLCSNAMNL